MLHSANSILYPLDQILIYKSSLLEPPDLVLEGFRISFRLPRVLPRLVSKVMEVSGVKLAFGLRLFSSILYPYLLKECPKLLVLLSDDKLAQVDLRKPNLFFFVQELDPLGVWVFATPGQEIQ